MIMALNWDNLRNLGELQCDYALQLQPMVEKKLQKSSEQYDLSVFLNPNVENDWGEKASSQFQAWRKNLDEMPPLGVLLEQTIEYFDIDPDNSLIPVAMAACLLGDIKHDNPYHNNPHFCEMTSVVLKLAAVHNELNESTDLKLSHDDILLLITAAAIHDFAHDGVGNTLNGTYVQSRLERQSLDKAKPFLQEMGIKDDDFQKVEMMVLCTDVTRGDSGQSRAGIARDIFLTHQHDNISFNNVSFEYEILLKDPKLSFMTMLVCDADIAMSSSLDYEFSKQMTRLVAEEARVIEANAKTLHGFMEVICHGGFLTRTSQLVLGQNFQGILLQSEQDMKEGVSFAQPKPKRPKSGIFL